MVSGTTTSVTTSTNLCAKHRKVTGDHENYCFYSIIYIEGFQWWIWLDPISSNFMEFCTLPQNIGLTLAPDQSVSRISRGGGVATIWLNFPENCMKMKKIEPGCASKLFLCRSDNVIEFCNLWQNIGWVFALNVN